MESLPMQSIDVSDLPEPVALVIAQLVAVLRRQLVQAAQPPASEVPELSRWDGTVIGTLSRKELYDAPSLSEILAPIHEEFRRSGMSEQELESLLEGELAEHRREREAAKDQP